MKTTMMIKTMMMIMVLTMMTMQGVRGHGMMLEPVQRSSLWRYRDRFPYADPNYEDNELFCGGYAVQWQQNGGLCGPCGDPYHLSPPRDNEAGGRFGQGVIVGTYSQGQVINVTIRITANHLGYFRFKLCPNNDVTQRVTQDCLDQHVLKVVGEDGQLNDRFYIGSFVGDKNLRVQLPADVTCTQCVLQWTYNTGNSWGCSSDNTCGLGLGPQENFVNCADIAVNPSDGNTITTAATTTTTTTTTTTSTASTTSSMPSTIFTTTTTTEEPNQPGEYCSPRPPWDLVPGMVSWCLTICDAGECYPSHCACN